jgi:type III secretion protein V
VRRFAEHLRRGDLEGLFKNYSDILLAVLVVAIVGMMIVPLPTFLLDLLLSLNITISVVLLMVAIYVSDALRIASFPTILLITTLFRLGLNVSSTRLILLQADAGEVIRSFGSFVVRGNLVVGAIVFLILTLIQFIVISKGSERVAEVAARFALDAMPGKQMSIDADVRAGVLDQDQARRRRSQLQRESQMYGSMDGAMKFVKGDAIAGIIIIVINIIGGLIIGVVQRDLAPGEALRVYSLLTIGDGLVSQIPALVISTAAGLIVTRVASEDEGGHLGSDIGGQILAQPKAIAIAGGLLLLLALIPGLPKIPFLLLGLVATGVAWSLTRKRAPAPGAAVTPEKARAARAAADELVATGVTPVALELSEDLAAACGVETGSGGRFLTEAIPSLRRTLYGELGVLVPGVRVRRVSGAAPGSWRLRLSEVPVMEGVVPLAKRLAGETPEKLQVLGIAAEPARNPASGRPASWVREEDRDPLAQAGVPTWDAPGVVTLATLAALKRYAHELVGIQEAQALLDALARTHPALVHEVVPKVVPAQLFADVLRRLVEEQVSIRDLRAILGALADWGRAEKDPVLLTEYVRASLKRQLTFQYTQGSRRLLAYLIAPEIEEVVRGAVQKTQTGSYLALEPEMSRDILTCVRKTLASRSPSAPPAVILASMEVRRYLRRLVEIEHPEVPVLSFQELVPDVNVQPVGRIQL